MRRLWAIFRGSQLGETLMLDDLGLNLSHTYTDGEFTDAESGEKSGPKTANIHTFKIDADYRINDQLALSYNGQFFPSNKYLASG